MYALHRVREDIAQIVLPKPGLPLPFGAPHNTYLILGDPHCLVGAPHPMTHGALRAALASLGLGFDDIRRIVALDWTPDQIAGAARFERADLFALSPDMIQPGDYAAVLRQVQRTLSARADALLEDDLYAQAMDRQPFEEGLAHYYQGLPDRLDIVPLRGGHALQLAHLRLQVIDAPGPSPGHMALFCTEGKMLFSGRLTSDRAFALPEIQDVKALLMSLEQLFDLGAELLLPSVGRVDDDASYTVRRSHRAMTGLLSNLPYALQGPMTIPSIIHRDLGYIPRHLGRFLTEIGRYEACFDELIRTAVILKEGQGVWALYGTEAPDPRVSRG